MTHTLPSSEASLPNNMPTGDGSAAAHTAPQLRPDGLRQAVADCEDVDKICEHYEVAWEQSRSGGAPRPTLNEYILDATYRLVPQLLSELVRVDIEQRQAAGEFPQRREYLDPYPGYCEVLQVV